MWWPDNWLLKTLAYHKRAKKNTLFARKVDCSRELLGSYRQFSLIKFKVIWTESRLEFGVCINLMRSVRPTTISNQPNRKISELRWQQRDLMKMLLIQRHWITLSLQRHSASNELACDCSGRDQQAKIQGMKQILLNYSKAKTNALREEN